MPQMHFPPVTSVLDEVDAPAGASWHSLAGVLSAHDNVRLLLSGHFHKGLDWEGLYRFPAYIIPSTRYNPQNFFLFDLHPDGSFDRIDAGKNRNASRCSDWWSYADGEAEFVAQSQPNDNGGWRGCHPGCRSDAAD
jgi:hypothetical protein